MLAAIFLLCALVTFGMAQSANEQPRRILIVYENDATLPAAIEIAQGIRNGLENGIQAKFETYSEYLDVLRFPGPENLSRRAADMAEKYRGLKMDVVIALGPGALRFMLEYCKDIAPEAPLIFGGTRAETLDAEKLPANSMGVVSRFDVNGTIDLARRLQPGARKIVVVTGSADFDGSWKESARRDLAGLPDDFEVSYLSGLTVEGFVDAVRRLDVDTILLVLTVIEDADGKRLIPREVAAQLAKASGAPAYGVYSTMMDIGLVGGQVEGFQTMGEDVARLAVAAISGEITPRKLVASTALPIVDWRQIQRFGLDASGLPENTEIRFRVPSAWEQYRTEILATVAVILFQSLLITALIVQGRRTKRAQEELEVGRLELTHLSRSSLLGELSGAFAHELNQPLTAILANAEVGRRILDQKEPDMGEVKEIFGEIVADDKRAAEIIRQLRSLLVKGEAALTPVDLNQVVTATLALTKSELVARQVKAEFQRELQEPLVLGNFAQLQQIVLNLIVNAAEAMAQIAPERRIVEITVRKGKDGHYMLAVSDNGPGLAPEMAEKAFSPFVSSKANGLGLGLAICRTIASAHGGTLRFDETRQNGARIVLTLPPREKGQ